jgi:hypothetical protein
MDMWAGDDQPIRVCPVGGAFWRKGPNPGFRAVEDPSDPEELAKLADACQEEQTVWLEARLDGLDEDQTAWLEGEYPIWKAMRAPAFDWAPMAELLQAVKLERPGPNPEESECCATRLLRALPYAYTRGTFGTVRDVLDLRPPIHSIVAPPDLRATVFPTAGFRPGALRPLERHVTWYTVIHATVAVIRRVVVLLRLPNSTWPENAPRSPIQPDDPLARVEVLERFLPRGRMASGREVAEAFGMHQATTARAVAEDIRTDLDAHEEVAAALTADDEEREAGTGKWNELPRAKLRRTAAEVVVEIDGVAEIAHLLDRNLATILRRFGGRAPGMDPVASELVPREVKRRYRFALDIIRSLHAHCQLSSQIMRQALANYEQAQREHFQFIAALLASIVLIPTLIAGVFGTNLQIPASKDPAGFYVFLAAIAGLALVGYFSVRVARKQDWEFPKKHRVLSLLAVLVIICAFAFYLARSDSGADRQKPEGTEKLVQTTNLPSSCITVPSTSIRPPSRRSQTRSVCTADSLTPPDSG